MPVYGYTDYTRPDRLGKFLDAISSSKQQAQLAQAQEERKTKEQSAASAGASTYSSDPSMENFLKLVSQGTESSKATSEGALQFQKERTSEEQGNLLPIGRGAGLYNIKDKGFVREPDKSYPAKLAPYMLKHPDDPDTAVSEMVNDEMRLKMAGVRGKTTLSIGGKPTDVEYMMDPDTHEMKISPIGEHFEKPPAGSKNDPKKVSLARIQVLTRHNQDLGEKMVAVDNSPYNHIGQKMSAPLTPQAIAQKANMQQQIKDNEAELEKHNKAIGGTFKAGSTGADDRTVAAKKHLEEAGYENDDESVKKFLDNNPKWKP